MLRLHSKYNKNIMKKLFSPPHRVNIYELIRHKNDVYYDSSGVYKKINTVYVLHSARIAKLLIDIECTFYLKMVPLYTSCPLARLISLASLFKSFCLSTATT